MSDSDESQDSGSRGRDVISAVQFRRGDEVLDTISESEAEVPREGEIIRMGEYHSVEGEDGLVFDGEGYVVRDVVHQYGSLSTEDDSTDDMLLVTTSVIMDEMSD